MTYYTPHGRSSARRMDSREIPVPLWGADGAIAATLGRRRGAIPRLGQCLGRRVRDWSGSYNDSARDQGTRFGCRAHRRTAASPRSGPQASGPSGPRVESRIGSAGRTGDSGRSPIAIALDLQKHANSGEGIEGSKALGRGDNRPPSVERSRLQSAGQPQDARRSVASGSGRTVSLYQPPGEDAAAAKSAHGLRRHQEERSGWQPEKPGPNMASKAKADRGQYA